MKTQYIYNIVQIVIKYSVDTFLCVEVNSLALYLKYFHMQCSAWGMGLNGFHLKFELSQKYIAESIFASFCYKKKYGFSYVLIISQQKS